MAQPPIKLRINLDKVIEEHVFNGQRGRYLNLVVWPKREGADQYGFTHSVKQEISREARDNGEQEPFVGDMKMPDSEAPAPRQQPQRPPMRPVAPSRRIQQGAPARPPVERQDESIADGMEDDDIPF